MQAALTSYATNLARQQGARYAAVAKKRFEDWFNGQGGVGENKQPRTIIRRPVFRGWNVVPMTRRMAHRHAFDGSLDLTAGQSVVAHRFKCDNIGAIIPGATTSTPAVGYNAMATQYQSYVVVGARIMVKILKGTSSPNHVYGRIRFHDGMTQHEGDEVLKQPEEEWLLQLRHKPWKYIPNIPTVQPNKIFSTIDGKYSLRKVRRSGNKKVDIVDNLVANTQSGPNYTFWVPSHYSYIPSMINLNDRFYWTIEFTTTGGLDATAIRYNVFIEWTVDWYDPKVTETQVADQTGQSVPAGDPTDLVVPTTTVTTMVNPLWSSETDPDPEATP